MSETNTTESYRTCPSCGGEMYQQGGPGVYWCEQCEREFWREGDAWWSCDESGEPERVEIVADGGAVGRIHAPKLCPNGQSGHLVRSTADGHRCINCSPRSGGSHE